MFCALSSTHTALRALSRVDPAPTEGRARWEAAIAEAAARLGGGEA